MEGQWDTEVQMQVLEERIIDETEKYSTESEEKKEGQNIDNTSKEDKQKYTKQVE